MFPLDVQAYDFHLLASVGLSRVVHPVLVEGLGVSRSADGMKTSWRGWSPSFMNPVAWSASLLPSRAVLSLVFCFHSWCIFTGWGCWPPSSHPLSGLVTGRTLSEGIQAEFWVIVYYLFSLWIFWLFSRYKPWTTRWRAEWKGLPFHFTLGFRGRHVEWQVHWSGRVPEQPVWHQCGGCAASHQPGKDLHPQSAARGGSDLNEIVRGGTQYDVGRCQVNW